MKRKLLVAGEQEIVFCVERKSVKNLNLRIRRDGGISVSVNRNVPCEEIDRFVLNKAKWILATIENFKTTAKLKPHSKKYVSGETFYMLGRGLRLKVSCAANDGITSDGAYIYLAVRDPTDYGNKSRIIRRFLDEQCKKVVEGIFDEIYPKFRKYGIEKPSLRIRSLKMRWGSCLEQKKIITINRRILEAPRHCIEYVILHELCHLVHPNHSKRFYCFLSAMMPDWKARKYLLEKVLTF